MRPVPELDHYVGRRVERVSEQKGDHNYTIHLEGGVDFQIHDKTAKPPAKGTLDDAVLQTVIYHGDNEDDPDAKRTRLHFSNGAQVSFYGAQVGIALPDEEQVVFPQSVQSMAWPSFPPDPSPDRIREGPEDAEEG